jgi:hypothetical protein
MIKGGLGEGDRRMVSHLADAGDPSRVPVPQTVMATPLRSQPPEWYG